MAPHKRRNLVLFKFPGGKSKMVDVIRSHIDDPIIRTGVYYEPFIGGGPVMLSIAGNSIPLEYPAFSATKLYANDMDPNVAAFWEFMTVATDSEFEKFMQLISRKPTIEMFWEEREKEKHPRDRMTMAYHCVFFHKTTFNGMYFASPIGGKKQKSKWTVGCHYTPENLMKRLVEARIRVRGRLNVSQMDIIRYLEDVVPCDAAMYLDPPYYTVGHTLYPVSMSPDEHLKLSEELRGRTNWVLSYDDCPEVRSMYDYAKIYEYPMWYSSSSFSSTGECATKTELIIVPK